MRTKLILFAQCLHKKSSAQNEPARHPSILNQPPSVEEHLNTRAYSIITTITARKQTRKNRNTNSLFLFRTFLCLLLSFNICSNCANDSLPVSVFASARLVKPQPVSSVSIGSCEDWCQICIDALGPTAIRYVQQKHPTLQRTQTFGTYLCI